MTREVKKPEIRKNEILATAQRFFFRKGFDSTSIQDIIDDLGIAKGTFYHYFNSKTDLLDQLLNSITDEMYSVLTPIVKSNRTAIDKFNTMFREGAAFKMTNPEVFVIMLKVLFTDENTILRMKMYRKMIEKNTPIYADIIKQGNDEGVFHVSMPEDTAEFLLQVGANWNETICRLLLKKDMTLKVLSELIQTKVTVYQYAMEDILHTQHGNIKFFQQGNLKDMVRLYLEQLNTAFPADHDRLYQRGY
jgi:AcrR family transcriptional regulator